MTKRLQSCSRRRRSNACVKRGRGSRSDHLKIGLTLVGLTTATTDGEGTSVQHAAVSLKEQGSGIVVKLGN